MVQQSSSLFNRPDTLFGVCEGVGQAFGFNANYLRIALAVALLWNPVAVIAAYGALGVAVALSRLLVPVKRPIPAAAAVSAPINQNDEAPALAAAA
ncbi:PspC domain-containing protein [Sphingomonas koreensis]|nr:PspC domain-containing protein [Sphingomonas koreensis]